MKFDVFPTGFAVCYRDNVTGELVAVCEAASHSAAAAEASRLNIEHQQKQAVQASAMARPKRLLRSFPGPAERRYAD